MKLKHCLLFPLCLFLFTSCMLLDRLGFDTYDYMSETVTGTVETEGETADEIRSLLGILVTDSNELTPFDGMREAIDGYREAVLSFMLKENYARYSGNTTLIEQAKKAYPAYQITEVIPETEFEATMYRIFGGSVKITHRDTERFRYLSRVRSYVATIDVNRDNCTIRFVSIDETEKTYRVRFRLSVGSDPEKEIGPYFALVIKRDDGTHYIKKLYRET